MIKPSISFRKAWNLYASDALDKMPKNITKDYAFVLQVHYVLGQIVKNGQTLKNGECVILRALADMEKKNIPLTFARLMIQKTIFE